MAGKKTWFVEADGHTNGVIAEELPTENASKDVLCHDEVKRNLWKCDYRFITKLLKNEATGHFDFKVFYQEGPHGPIKPWPFLRRRRMTLAMALKKGIVKKASALAAPARLAK